MAPKTSSVWEFFTLLSDEKAKCDICKSVFSYKGSSTSNLNKHLQRHPGAFRPSKRGRTNNSETHDNEVMVLGGGGYEPSSSSSTTATSSTTVASSTTVTSGNDIIRHSAPTLAGFLRRPMTGHLKKKNDRLTQKMIVNDMQPFSMVEDVGLRELLASLAPWYQLPSRTTLTRNLFVSQYEDMVLKVQKELDGVNHVCLTTDIWTSRTTQAYIAITAHYVKEWRMKGVLLGCIAINGSHTGVMVRNELFKVSITLELY